MNRKTASFQNFRSNRVRVEDTDYRRSHMTAPRGRGSWAFRFDRGTEDWFAPTCSTFADARKAAVEEARRRGARVARVQP